MLPLSFHLNLLFSFKLLPVPRQDEVLDVPIAYKYLSDFGKTSKLKVYSDYLLPDCNTNHSIIQSNSPKSYIAILFALSCGALLTAVANKRP